MTFKKANRIYDQGTAEEIEDGSIINPPFFGVVDGASAAYRHKSERILFDGLTGGEMIRKVVLDTFCSVKVDLSLEEIVLQANQRIGEIQQTKGIPINRSDLLATASFVFVKTKRKEVEIIQGGDCFALLMTKEGKTEVTRNQCYFHDVENLEKIAELMKKHEGNREKMWADFAPILSARRLRDTNKKTKTGYAQLNGQPWITEHWEKIVIPEPRFLLLFSDGLVSFEDTADPKKLAEKVLRTYQKGGLGLLLQENRRRESAKEKTSYIKHQEATAVEIIFDKPHQ